MTALRFTLADLEASGLTCGPAALAAICGLTLDEARECFPDFPGWCSPSMMLAALASAGRTWRWVSVVDSRASWPRYGLALIEFEGPWTAPNPAREHWLKIERAKRSHWVGAWTTETSGVGIWDVNCVDRCTTRGNGWTAMATWEAEIAPALAASYRRASGGWHITHAIEVERP